MHRCVGVCRYGWRPERAAVCNPVPGCPQGPLHPRGGGCLPNSGGLEGTVLPPRQQVEELGGELGPWGSVTSHQGSAWLWPPLLSGLPGFRILSSVSCPGLGCPKCKPLP